VHFGEGTYEGSERAIRSLLASGRVVAAGEHRRRRRCDAEGARDDARVLPRHRAPTAYVGSKLYPNQAAGYTFATTIPPDDLSYAAPGTSVRSASSPASTHACACTTGALRLYVLGGRGTVHTLSTGSRRRRSA